MHWTATRITGEVASSVGSDPRPTALTGGAAAVQDVQWSPATYRSLEAMLTGNAKRQKEQRAGVRAGNTPDTLIVCDPLGCPRSAPASGFTANDENVSVRERSSDKQVPRRSHRASTAQAVDAIVAASCCGDPCCGDPCCNDPCGAACGDPCACDPCACDPCSCDPCSPECVNCDDVDACTTDTCSGGACQHTPLNCDDGDRCTTDSCDPAMGGCVNAPVECPTCEECDSNAIFSPLLCEPVCGCPTQSVVREGNLVDASECPCPFNTVILEAGCDANLILSGCYRKDMGPVMTEGTFVKMLSSSGCMNNCPPQCPDASLLPQSMNIGGQICFTSEVATEVSNSITVDAAFLAGTLETSIGATNGQQTCASSACTITAAPCTWTTGEQYIDVRQGRTSQITHMWKWYIELDSPSAGCSCTVMNADCGGGVSTATGNVGVAVKCDVTGTGACCLGECGGL